MNNNVTAASINDERSDNQGRKTVDERVFPHAENYSSLPADPSHDQNHAAASTISSFSSVLHSPMELENSGSLSAVNVGVDSRQNSSTAASDSMEQQSSTTVQLSPGNNCIG